MLPPVPPAQGFAAGENAVSRIEFRGSRAGLAEKYKGSTYFEWKVAATPKKFAEQSFWKANCIDCITRKC
jgi:hypothetical protein